MTYGKSVTVALPFGETVVRVREALAEQGFGILTEIDVQATLRTKLNVETPPHVILGACNPPLAHEALTIDPSLGLLLPCNVVVRAPSDGTAQDGGPTIVAAIDPRILVDATGNGALSAVAVRAGDRLDAALAALAALDRPATPAGNPRR